MDLTELDFYQKKAVTHERFFSEHIIMSVHAAPVAFPQHGTFGSSAPALGATNSAGFAAAVGNAQSLTFCANCGQPVQGPVSARRS